LRSSNAIHAKSPITISKSQTDLLAGDTEQGMCQGCVKRIFSAAAGPKRQHKLIGKIGQMKTIKKERKRNKQKE
jgi:hypothetical protein